MAIIDQNKFYKDLESGNVSPVYFIFGDEPFLIDQCVNRFKYGLLDENSFDFNYSLFYASDADVQSIKDTVETLPVFAQRRVVILKNSHELKESEWNELESLFKNPVDSTVFVLFADKIDKRKKHFKNLIDTSSALEFKKPYDNEIPRWINYYASQYELKLTQGAVHRLHRLVGNNLSEIYAQLEKIKVYLDGAATVDVEHVNAVVSNSREESVFDFTKAVGQKDRVRALEQIVSLLDQGQNEIGIVNLLARHMRILLTVRTGMDQGIGGAKLANLANVSPYFIEEYCAQAKGWPVRKLEESLVLLGETDKALKSSPLSSHIWLENMVLKSCSM
ncbi:DNA polymerase III subunit delta [Pseudobdellovibrio sp. HCB154]|uniref:DNA polymerase III subunit delta n=1 Tax=Pseudobdellovibrio sp. HCB154 TaxID=3386277 RepID=UPI00391747D7